LVFYLKSALTVCSSKGQALQLTSGLDFLSIQAYRLWMEHPSREKVKEIAFSLAFVTRQKEVDAIAKTVARKAKGDAIVWFAYPKGTSKKHQCEFNRDTGWAALGAAGFEGVRMVAIDEDWSALRFRRVEFIQTMARDKKRAMTKQGKKKVTKK
jgi:hypothetical protein